MKLNIQFDGGNVETHVKYGIQSDFIKNMISGDIDMNIKEFEEKKDYYDKLSKAIIEKNDVDKIDIPLNDTICIKYDIGKLIVEFMEHHYNNIYENEEKDKDDFKIPKPLEKDIKEVFDDWDDEWYSKFVDKFNNDSLQELSISCNKISYKDLLKLSCATLVSRMRDLSVEEIRKMLHVKNDFTPEELEKIRQENSWCLE